MSNFTRRGLMNNIADNIKANSEELARIESTDNGKAINMARRDA